MQLEQDGDLAIEEPSPTAWFPEEDLPGDELPPPTSTGPASSASNAPPVEGTTLDEARIAKLELDERHRNDFEGLMFLGELRDTFKWSGHTFSIHTLRVDELLEVGQLVKRYEGTVGANRAYITAFVAASLDRVDGRNLHNPLGPQDSVLEGKFRYIAEHWYAWTTDQIYSRCMMLEARVAEIIEAMGEAGG